MYSFIYMIYVKTSLISADNAGAKKLECIKLLQGFNKKKSNLGGLIKVSVAVKKITSKKIINKIYYALIVNTKSIVLRKNGHTIRFGNNKCLLLKENFVFLGTRVFGPICKEIRNLKYKRIVSYSNSCI